MTKQFEAVYENGVLRPLAPLSLEEHERVVVTAVPTGDGARPFWETATPEERVDAWKRWLSSCPRTDSPELPDEALKRESLYE